MTQTINSCAQAIKAITGKEQEYTGIRLPEDPVVKDIIKQYRKSKKKLAPDICKTKCKNDFSENIELNKCILDCNTKHEEFQNGMDYFETQCVMGNKYQPKIGNSDRFTSKPCDSIFGEIVCDLWKIWNGDHIDL